MFWVLRNSLIMVKNRFDPTSVYMFAKYMCFLHISIPKKYCNFLRSQYVHFKDVSPRFLPNYVSVIFN